MQEFSILSVDAVCDDKPDDNYSAEVTVSSLPGDTVKVFNWPGFQMLSFDSNHSKQLTRRGITARGSYFSSFTILLPFSFRNDLQRDRVVHHHNKDLMALMGSAIMAACEKEKALAGPKFPSNLVSMPIKEVIQKLQFHYPFNFALVKLIFDNLTDGSDVQNINILSLQAFGARTKLYLSDMMSFQPIVDSDSDSVMEVALIAWQDMERHKASTELLRESSDGLLKDPKLLPPQKVHIFIYEYTFINTSFYRWYTYSLNSFYI